MKKFLAMTGLTMGLFTMAGTAMAVNPASLVLRVTPGVTRDVVLSTGLVNMGTLNLGTVNNITASSVTVTNGGTSNVSETFALRINGGVTVWTAGAAAGADIYHLRAIFNAATVPVTANFGPEDDMTTTSTASSATVYSNGVETGVSVPVNGARGLWFKLDLPTTSSSAASQDIGVEVLGQ